MQISQPQISLPKRSNSISIERIISKEFLKLDLLVCSLCNNLLIDIKKCSLCNSHFCYSCIISLRDNDNESSECPKCNIPNSYLEDGEAYVKKYISDLQITCKYSSKGCKEICYFQNIFDHEAICKYREKACENCSRILDYEDYYNHLIDCYQINGLNGHKNQQDIVLYLIKALDDKLSRIYYQNKHTINTLKLEKQKSLGKLDEKIRLAEQYIAEQDYLIRTAELEKYKITTPLSLHGKCLEECQVYYYCKGAYNGCNKTGNVWGSNPYTSDSVICLAALHSGHITKEGGLFIVKKGGCLTSFVGSVKNGVTTQGYGSFDHIMILPSELEMKLNFTTNQCGVRIGICKGKCNGCKEKGEVWGDNPFVRESNLCKASLHSGIISENGGMFMIEESGPHGGYPGITKNGITSLSCSANLASITIKPFVPY